MQVSTSGNLTDWMANKNAESGRGPDLGAGGVPFDSGMTIVAVKYALRKGGKL